MKDTLLVPFSFAIDTVNGTLAPERPPVQRRLDDMKTAYAQETSGDDLVYEVRQIDVPTTNSNLLSSTTTLYPGKTNGEYYMTKGHFHQKRDRAEVYIGLSGEGRLLMSSESGEVVVEEMRAGSVNYVPGGWAHRSVNVGEEPLVFYAVYIADAGQDYLAIEHQGGFPVIIVEGENGPEAVPNPRFQQA
ncbi:glucose-6-phosphate isomerase family protein [Arthrobacter sp. MA-N2]|uniref:glucose-6-phosphate isomerase family protein n=1 Tax=Arthrobacter sp. MA-N2 TaxID=1101188 RepID=UPI0004B1A7C8|nr:glucose-6-phosphate isomerase family protein [Arthrobacter sp. MA-N2]